MLENNFFNTSNETNKPLFTVFLDIDGVVNDYHSVEDVEQKYEELFGQKVTMRRGNIKCLTAQSHLFDVESLKNLDEMLSQIEKVATVQIVISSMWRTFAKNFKAMKKDFFSMHNFSKYIVDRTVDKVNTPSNYCTYEGHKGAGCRAAEIQKWLTKNPQAQEHFAVLDDIDDHLSHLFKERFIKINPKKLLTMKKVNKVLELLKHIQV